METKYVCNSCGSDDVAREAWISYNSNEFRADFKTESIQWCFKCNTETTVESEDGYSDEEPKEICLGCSMELKNCNCEIKLTERGYPDSGEFLSDSWLDKADDKTEREEKI